MKQKTLMTGIMVFSFVIGLALVVAAPAAAGDYEAMKGVKHVDTIFDFRDGKVNTALVHLSLIHQTYTDKTIQGMAEKPEFVVVFMSGAVKLLSSNRDKFTDEERKKLEEFDKVISAIAEEPGIRMEVCLFAVDLLGVDPESISKEIERVPNGWISELGYQARGYGLVPVY